MELAGALQMQAHTSGEFPPAAHVAVIMQEEQVRGAMPVQAAGAVQAFFLQQYPSFPITFPRCCLQAFFRSLASPSGLPLRPMSPAPASQSRQQNMQLLAAMGRCGAAGRAALAAAYIDMLRTYAPHPAMVSALISIRMTLAERPFNPLDIGQNRTHFLVHRLWLRGTPSWGAAPGRWQSAW